LVIAELVLRFTDIGEKTNNSCAKFVKSCGKRKLPKNET